MIFCRFTCVSIVNFGEVLFSIESWLMVVLYIFLYPLIIFIASFFFQSVLSCVWWNFYFSDVLLLKYSLVDPLCILKCAWSKTMTIFFCVPCNLLFFCIWPSFASMNWKFCKQGQTCLLEQQQRCGGLSSCSVLSLAACHHRESVPQCDSRWFSELWWLRLCIHILP